MDTRADQRQSQTLSPRLQHAVRLLQMSSLDFGTTVRDVLGRNPFLELEEGAEEGEEGAAPEVTEAADTDDLDADVQSGDQEMESDRALWLSDGTPSRNPRDSDVSALDMMAADSSLNMHLHEQLNTLKLSERDLALARVIVESLDDDGYLRTPLTDLLSIENLEPAASLTDMQIALKLVQSLDPVGVGARDLAECLQLQLQEIECPQMRRTARTIVTDHLERLAGGDLASLARAMGRPVRDVQAVCDRIRRFDPHPGWRLGSSRVDYIVPDVLVRKVRGEWTVQLNSAIVPRVRLNETYVNLFQRHRSTDNAEMGAHLQEARWTLRNVEQRFSTILEVAQAIVRRQRHFLEYGAMAMKPLGLKEIADEVGVHESTVSRVTNNKYMATPTGVYELKHFFSRAMVSANGKACSGTAIRGLIKDIIEAESAGRPLSDADITQQLGQQGLMVARRTVTKYRQMLHIEPVERRRRHGAAALK